jgi:beta-aspartyl-peptidase (threonine type)
MKTFRVLSAVIFTLCILPDMARAQTESTIRIVVHGGAGTIRKENMTPVREKQYHQKLAEALRAGYDILKGGGTSLDAVETTVRILEDSPLFNAGKGAVFTSEGTNELDAAIMDGATLKAGSVAGLKRIKNPISLARLVMEESPHVVMIGDGAETFAQQHGVEFVDPSYFRTDERWQQLMQAKEREKQSPPKKEEKKQTVGDEQFGTVGAVALDRHGNLAAATSTGGMTNKKFGRVGDVPIIGAGTYANNRTCGVSATGTGEYFIRSVVGHDISALMEYKGLSVKDAAEMVMEKVRKLGGDGGVIVLDNKGNVAMPFTSAGMYRGYIDEKGDAVTKIYRE